MKRKICSKLRSVRTGARTYIERQDVLVPVKNGLHSGEFCTECQRKLLLQHRTVTAKVLGARGLQLNVEGVGQPSQPAGESA